MRDYAHTYHVFRTMKQYFVVADVHSFYDEMMTALAEQGYDPANPDHVFVSLGDLLDRGTQPIQCLDFVNALAPSRKILVRGNHEDLLEECLAKKKFLLRDMHNGTEDTVIRLAGMAAGEFYQGDYHARIAAVRQDARLRKYLSDLVDYAEIGRYVLVHGWIPAEEDWRAGDWAHARWDNGMQCWYNGYFLKGRTIVCGHWHTSWGHAYIDNHGTEFGVNADFSPFAHEGILAIDACTAHTHRVNCVVLTAP